ncbi:MAG: ABC transporter permease [Gammaproteobacteria bacterium]|nr:MAG: ABC transporter permease [Gammaproteobacteria bacterium]RLA13242.1 MAG: ABC transporter permease [Gammaproteobacteria bacterium]
MRAFSLLIGAALLLVMVSPWFALQSEQINLNQILSPPSMHLLLGGDELGRSIGERLLVGARLSLLVAVVVVAFSAVLGISVGLVAGYLGGWVDQVIVRVIDVVLAFPGLLLAIALAGMLGPGIDNLVLALITVGWVGFARLTRAQVLSLRESDHVQAARALGSGAIFIMSRHLLPLAYAPLVIEATFGLAGAVLAEASLSFLGLGIQPPSPTWGSMIRDGARYMLVAPHYVLAPGAALLLVVLTVNLIGDNLRDRLDIRRT